MNGLPKNNYKALWLWACIFSLLFWLGDLSGFRDFTSIWSGTHVGEEWTYFAGLYYLFFYIIWVCVVPILVIAGVLDFFYLNKKNT